MNIYATALKYKRKMDSLDERSLKIISNEYKKSFHKLKKEYEKLSKEVIESGIRLPYSIERMQRVQELIKQTNDEIEKLHTITVNIIKNASDQAINLSIDNSKNLLSLVFSMSAANKLEDTFNQVNKEAYVKMIGFTADGSPLLDVLKKNTPYSSKEAIISTLRHGVLIGDSPLRMARQMVDLGYSDKKHAMTVARTETMRVARTVGLESYKASGILKVQWVSGKTATTCAACWAMDGQIFPINNIPHDHVNGRCSYNPYIEELAEDRPGLYSQDTEKQFKSLTEKEKIRVLGAHKYDLYIKDRIRLSDIATIQKNKIWGNSVKIDTIENVINRAQIGKMPELRKEYIGKWVESAHNEHSIALKKATADIYGGHTHNPAHTSVTSSDVLWVSPIVKSIKKSTEKYLQKNFKDDTITLYRGIKTKIVKSGAVESWTIDKSIALEFAKGNEDMVQVKEININTILSFYETKDWASGSIQQKEYLILGGL